MPGVDIVELAVLAFGAAGFIFGLAGMLHAKASARQLANHLADHQALAIVERRRRETDEHHVHTNGHHR